MKKRLILKVSAALAAALFILSILHSCESTEETGNNAADADSAQESISKTQEVEIMNMKERKDLLGIGNELLIGAWYGVDLNYTAPRYLKEVAEAGIDFIFAWYNGASQRDEILDNCGAAGIKCVLMDGSISGDASEYKKSTADYASHPAFWGNNIKDEPSISEFDEVFRRCSDYAAVLPDKLPFTNLFPMYADERQLGVPDYEEYVDEFAKRVTDGYLSVDIYPFDESGGNKTTYAGYFKNLDITASACRKYGLDLWVFIQSMGFNVVKRPPSLADFRYQAYACLSFGAKAIMHFCYATPPSGGETFEYALIGLDGEKTPLWHSAKTVNDELKAISGVYMQYKNLGAFCHKAGPYVVGLAFSNQYKNFDVIEKIESNESLLVGCFEKNSGEGYAFTLLNASELSRESSADIKFTLKSGGRVTAYIKGTPAILEAENGAYSIALETGEGVFITVD